MRVLVARLDNAGDVLLTGPAVRAVASAPGVEVVFLCRPGSRQAAALLPGVDHILTFEAPWVPLDPPSFDPATVADLVETVSRVSPDEAVVMTSWHQSPLRLLCSRLNRPWWLPLRQLKLPKLLSKLRWPLLRHRSARSPRLRRCPSKHCKAW